MRESGDYPPGAEFDPNAPFNQEQHEETTFIETHLIPVNVDGDLIDVCFNIEFETNGEEIFCEIIDFEYPYFMQEWNEDIRIFLVEDCESSKEFIEIKLSDFKEL